MRSSSINLVALLIGLILISSFFGFLVVETDVTNIVENDRVAILKGIENETQAVFYENIGQIPNTEILFYGRINSGFIGFGIGKIILLYQNSSEMLVWTFGEGERSTPEGLYARKQVSNFLLGERGTYRNIKSYSAIVYKDVWTDISLVYSQLDSNAGLSIEVRNGADVSEACFNVRGIDSLEILNNKIHYIRDQEVAIYDAPQFNEAHSQTNLKIDKLNDTCFYFANIADGTVDSYIIAPLLSSTVFGGANRDFLEDIAIDYNGYIYAIGRTYSSSFQLTSSLDTYNPENDLDCFVAKFDPNGTMVCTTFIGGTNWDRGESIDVDLVGQVYITGYTASMDFPIVSPNSFEQNYQGGFCDSFILKLDSQITTILHSSFIGGSSGDYARAISVDSTGTVFIVGHTGSFDFPIVNSETHYHGGVSDVFILSLDSSRNSLIFSTLSGGASQDYCEDIALGEQYIYLTGYTDSEDFQNTHEIKDKESIDFDSYVMKLSKTSGDLIYSTVVGSSTDDFAYSLDIDSLGNAYVTGYTKGLDFPSIDSYDSSFNGKRDIFVFKLGKDGTNLEYSTYVGGYGNDRSISIMIDNRDCANIVGYSDSRNFPQTDPNGRYQGGFYDSVVFRLSGTGEKLEYSRFVGGLGNDRGRAIIVDNRRNIFIAGVSDSSNFPMNYGGMMMYGLSDCFIIKISTDDDDDLDGLSNQQEEMLGTNSQRIDTDYDMMPDGWEISVGLNPLVYDSDEDMDNDDLSNLNEFLLGTNPFNNDTDSDALPDGWEVQFGLSPIHADSGNDTDSDNLTNLREFLEGCNPINQDSDSDLLLDGFEVNILGSNPLSNDSDSDGIDDFWEFLYHLNPSTDDSIEDFDSDNLVNILEYIYSTNPLLNDTDSDLLPDDWEVTFGLDPLYNDSFGDMDNDGIDNLLEYLLDSNPLDIDSDNDMLNDTMEYYILGTSLTSNDTDNDKIGDYDEYYLYGTNPLNTDSDTDSVGDWSEIFVYFTNPLSGDTDNDNMPDYWEISHSLDPNMNDSASDADNDLIINLNEFLLNTNPQSNDTDNDKINDNEELMVYHTNPSKADSDSDNLDDYDEINVYLTNATLSDTDKDNLPDGWEILYGLNPLVNDSSNDLDGDLLTNLIEYQNGARPDTNDSDGDQINDWDEVMLYHTNPSKSDSDGDLLDDYQEVILLSTNPNLSDSDGDSLSDSIELTVYFTNATNMDTDYDMIPDGWEVLYSLNPKLNDSLEDPDFDNLTNYEEWLLKSNPQSNDSDGDTLSDFDEVTIYLTNPTKTDSDSDSMPDNWEILYNLDPGIDDSGDDEDFDGLTNLEEYFFLSHPRLNDTDADLLGDFNETMQYFTNPNSSDSDGDTIDDWSEIFQYATNPNSNDTDSDNIPDDWELETSLNPLVNDANGDPDNDKLINYIEFEYDLDPYDSDSDDDLLNDAEEVNLYHTNAGMNDTDSDLMPDGWEVQVGLDPNLDDSSDDLDDDGLDNLLEYEQNTNPDDSDSDDDLLSDALEVLTYSTNPLLNDTDGDSLSDYSELMVYQTNPLVLDSDSDELPDAWEVSYHTNPNSHDATEDPDGDNLSNLQEFLSHTNPNLEDSDGDSISDYNEVMVYSTNPNSVDTDQDNLSDSEEIFDYLTNPLMKDSDSDNLNDWVELVQYSTNPNSADSDDDAMPDGWEITYSLDPLTYDSEVDFDLDGLSNLQEFNLRTSPRSTDSDGDSLDDYSEVYEYGTNPSLADSDFDYMPDGWELQYNLDPLTYDADLDPDGDHLTNKEEFLFGTSPRNEDSDFDNLQDDVEIFQFGSDPSSNDTDRDKLSDYAELYIYYTDPTNGDSDFDALGDYQEVIVYATDPNNNDSDSDALPDGWEVQYSLNPLEDSADADVDMDSLTNLQEYYLGTDPTSYDTDKDTLGDFQEVYQFNTNPVLADSDGDAMPDNWELEYGLNPLSWGADIDTDNDSVVDLIEYQFRCNPNRYDSDNDSLTDAQEIFEYNTDPTRIDTDGDSLTDYEEVSIYLTDPNSSDTDKDTIDDSAEINFYGTNPLAEDSDMDGISDAWEIQFGFDPLNPEVGILEYLTFNGMNIVLLACVMISLIYISKHREEFKTFMIRQKRRISKDS